MKLFQILFDGLDGLSLPVRGRGLKPSSFPNSEGYARRPPCGGVIGLPLLR